MRFSARSLKVSFLGLLSLLACVSFSSATTHAQTKPADCTTQYCALTTIPGVTEECEADKNGRNVRCGEPTNPVKVIKNIYTISIGIGALLALAMIIWAGMEYATTEAITGKSDAKDKWQGAIFGLVLLLSSFLILSTINVDLVDVDLALGEPLTGVLVKGDPLQDFLAQTQQGADAAVKRYQAEQEAVAVAQKKVADAEKSGNASELAAAQAALKEAQNRQYAAQIEAKHKQATVNATKALQEGNYDQAVQIATDSVAQQQAAVNQMGDSEAKAAAQSNISLNLENARVDIASVSILTGLQDGRYPTFGGADKFHTARSKFLSETNKVVQELSTKNPQAVAAYRAHTIEQLRLIDSKWEANLKKCPRGYTVQGGCNK